MKNQIAEAYLKKGSVGHIDMLEALRRGIGQVLYAGKDGVQMLVRETYMQSASSPEAARRLTAMLPNHVCAFVAHESYGKTAFEERFRGTEQFHDGIFCNPCRFAVWTEKTLVQVSGEYQIGRLTEEYTEAVEKQYHLFDDLAYIAERIQAGTIYGAFSGDELAGFIGEHSEGGIGMLEVYPAFRRKGVGSVLVADAVNRGLSAGKTAYGDVILGNEASFALQHSLGMTISEAEHYWLFA